MKISKKICIIFVLLFIFMFKIDVANAEDNQSLNMINNVNIFKDNSSFIAKSKKKSETATETTKEKSKQLELENNSYEITCDDVKMLHDIWYIITIISPILVILMGILDFGKAVISGKEDEMQKSWKKFPKRLLALVLLFLVPLLISLLLNLTVDEAAKNKNLMYCIINGGE